MSLPLTHTSAVMHETVLVTLMLAALNLLKVMTADIINAHITTLCKEKIWTTLGSKFRKDKGNEAIIV